MSPGRPSPKMMTLPMPKMMTLPMSKMMMLPRPWLKTQQGGLVNVEEDDLAKVSSQGGLEMGLLRCCEPCRCCSVAGLAVTDLLNFQAWEMEITGPGWPLVCRMRAGREEEVWARR